MIVFVVVKEIETECSVFASHLVLASSFEGAAVTDILSLLLAILIYSSVNSKLILHVATHGVHFHT
jgi:hypothetical protein